MMNLAIIRQQAKEAVELGELDRAVEILQAAIERHPVEIELFHDLAECQWAAYDFQSALETYARASRAKPDLILTYVQAAKKLFGLGRFSESAQWLEQAVTLGFDDASILTMLAEVYERDNRPAEAERYATAALDRAPQLVKAVRIMAHLEQRLGRIERGRERLFRHLAHHSGPDDWCLRYELADILDRLGEFSGAMQQLLLAKEQLRVRALPFVAEANRIRKRQKEFAQHLQRETLLGWKSKTAIRGAPRRLGFLVGHPRSGTTLLEQMLGTHEQVVTTDETGILQREFIRPMLCGPGSVQEAAAELEGLDSDQIEMGRAAYWKYTEAHLGERVGSRMLIEKDPALTPDLPLPLRLFPEARVVFPLRDPRDVCLSYFFTLVPLAPVSAAALDLRSTCESCVHSLELWMRWKEVLPFPWLETHYENLVTNPEPETRRLFQFLELPWSAEVLKFHERPRSQGIRTPTYSDVAQPLYRRAIGRWKNYESFLQPHFEVLRPFLRSFGYA